MRSPFAALPFLLVLPAGTVARADECSPEDAERLVDALVEIGGWGRTTGLGLDGGLQLDEAALREAAVLVGCDLVEDLGATIEALDRTLWADEGRGFGGESPHTLSLRSEWWRVLLPQVRFDLTFRFNDEDARTGSRIDRIEAGFALWILWSLARWGG